TSGFLIMKFVQETTAPKPDERPKHSLLSNYGYAFQSKPIRIALGIMLISQVSVFMIQPIFALFVESLVSNTEYIATMAGAIFSVVGVFTVISAPWWGKRNDVKSYKKNLSIALFGAGISYAAQGLVINPYQLIFFRATLGFCLGGMLPTLYSYVSKNSILERRGGIMGIASSFNILANMIGPPAGGFIAAHIGLRQNFFITGGFLMLAVVFVRLFFIDMRENQDLAAGASEQVERAVTLEE
ncbi:MAG TPA: MFS transporter, partial [Bacteroidota bacterium]|nr:MFS transporter [Bacteroidota bacterium]